MGRQISIAFGFFAFFVFVMVALFSYSPNDSGVLSFSMHSLNLDHSANLSGKVGASISDAMVSYFGFGSWFIVLLGMIVSAYSLRRRISVLHVLSAVLLGVVVSVVISTVLLDVDIIDRYSGGGIIGNELSNVMVGGIGQIGVLITALGLLIAYFIYVKVECLD